MSNLKKFVDTNGETHTGYFVDDKRVIHFAKSIHGKVVHFTTGATNIVTAKRFVTKELKHRGQLEKSKAFNQTLGPLLDSYIQLREHEYQSGEIVRRTYLCVKNSLDKAKPYWEEKIAADLGRDEWAEFCRWYADEYDNQLMFNVSKYMRSFCRYLREKGILHHEPSFKDPTKKRARIARKKKNEKTLSDEEVTAIFQVCSKRDQLLILLLYTMAFRGSEACGLKWEDLDMSPEDPTFKFKEDNNKAGHIGSQSLHPEVYKRLGELKLRKSGPVFPQVNNKNQCIKLQQVNWKRIKKDSGVMTNWSSHSFRRACLTKLFSDPKNPQAIIMKCYRVSLAVALEHYIQITDDARKAMRSAIEVKL